MVVRSNVKNKKIRSFKLNDKFSIWDCLIYFILIAASVVTLYPLLYIALCSISDVGQVLSSDALLVIPKQITFIAYESVMKSSSIITGYINSLFYMTVGTIISVVLTLLAGYVISRKWLYGKWLLIAIVTIPMFITGGMIPTYMVVKNFKMLDTVWAVLLPHAVLVWNVIITRTFFDGIPGALEEAAKIDGAGDFCIFSRIFVPISKPVIAINILYYAIGRWNSWFDAMIYLKNRELYPLQLFLREILVSSEVTNMGAISQQMALNIKYATIIVTILPILLIYPFVQKYFVKGVMIGAIKG